MAHQAIIREFRSPWSTGFRQLSSVCILAQVPDHGRRPLRHRPRLLHQDRNVRPRNGHLGRRKFRNVVSRKWGTLDWNPRILSVACNLKLMSCVLAWLQGVFFKAGSRKTNSFCQNVALSLAKLFKLWFARASVTMWRLRLWLSVQNRICPINGESDDALAVKCDKRQFLNCISVRRLVRSSVHSSSEINW